MTDQEAKEKKIIGDNLLVAEVLGLQKGHVRAILRRPTSNKYPIVMDTLKKIIENRDKATARLKAETK